MVMISTKTGKEGGTPLAKEEYQGDHHLIETNILSLEEQQYHYPGSVLNKQGVRTA